MPTVTLQFEYTNNAERLALEQALAFVTHLRQLAITAADGTVLQVCEQAALPGGRDLLRNTLAAALQTRIDAAQPKGGPRGFAPRRTPDATRAEHPQGVLTRRRGGNTLFPRHVPRKRLRLKGVGR